jgi:hypothetical protein
MEARIVIINILAKQIKENIVNREDLLNAIDELKDSEDIEQSITNLKVDYLRFCDHYETEFNNIRDDLEELAPHIEKVDAAFSTARNCSNELY